ncbi:hypothetical protein BJF78_36385 [Pseudonocardia sp. CNS-139]|nr:hypothetical protein BJF78_36385 [Pseudonocardia sp. CNS-139]
MLVASYSAVMRSAVARSWPRPAIRSTNAARSYCSYMILVLPSDGRMQRCALLFLDLELLESDIDVDQEGMTG